MTFATNVWIKQSIETLLLFFRNDLNHFSVFLRWTCYDDFPNSIQPSSPGQREHIPWKSISNSRKVAGFLEQLISSFSTLGLTLKVLDLECQTFWSALCTSRFWLSHVGSWLLAVFVISWNYLRNSPRHVFCKKGVFKNFAKFTGKHRSGSSFLMKLQSWSQWRY